MLNFVVIISRSKRKMCKRRAVRHLFYCSDVFAQMPCEILHLVVYLLHYQKAIKNNVCVGVCVLDVGKIHTPMEYKGELASYEMRLRYYFIHQHSTHRRNPVTLQSRKFKYNINTWVFKIFLDLQKLFVLCNIYCY